MKTFLNAQDKDEILARLAKLRPDSVRRWGRMSAAQMMCHLADSFQARQGGRGASSASNFLSRTVIKWIALETPLPWARGFKTMPEYDQEIGGTPPVDFDQDRHRLAAAIERFTVPLEPAELQPHPLFGDMSHAEWMRWGYLHCDHHLRQFGL